MGDPAGIGPEIVCKALLRLADPRSQHEDSRIVVIGSGEALAAAARLLGPAAERTVDALRDQSTTARDSRAQVLLDVSPPGNGIRVGAVSAEGGRLAYLAVERAVGLALSGEIDAIVTAPLSKEALHLAGYRFAGHTELLAHLTGSSGAVMLLVHGNMRVSHVSTHIALSQVAGALTPARLTRVVECTHQALIDLGIARPRIAVAALNPHGGEGGIFGDEDETITAPTVDRLRSAGIDLHGPLPGDTVFVKMRGGQFDAVVAMYHDQGHIPVKLLGFRIDPETGQWSELSGVNVTLGLPIVRTSVDHGTAFDIAGRGIANEDSLVEAIALAVRLSQARGADRARARSTAERAA